MSRALYVAASVAFLGCAEAENEESPDDSDPVPTVEASHEGWSAVRSYAGSQVDGFAAEAADGGETDIDSTVDCPEGGSARFSGSFDGPDSFAVNIDFADCGTNGVVVNQDLHISASSDSGAVSYVFDGTLRFGGTVVQKCRVDATGELTNGAVASVVSPELAFAGFICGLDAAEVNEGG